MTTETERTDFLCDRGKCPYASLDKAIDDGSQGLPNRQTTAPDVTQAACSVAKEITGKYLGIIVPCGLAAAGVVESWRNDGSAEAIAVERSMMALLDERLSGEDNA